MAYSTISKPSLHFNTKLYTGSGSTQSITGVGFQPDWVWIKRRSSSQDHNLYDVIRGATKALESNSTSAEQTKSDDLTAFASDGFTLGSGVKTNANSETHVAWNWKANGSGSSNSDGSIASTVSANTTAGFSIVRWSGSSANATIGHGLGVVPKMIICKDTNDTYNWGTYHQAIGNTKYLYLNTNAAKATSTSAWNDTTPTSTVFSVGNAGATNASGTNNMIAYCFAEKKGFSKFGSYTGNGNADGTFVYTGFKPAWVMAKRTDSTSSGAWVMWDNKRSPFNSRDEYLVANTNGAEGSSGTAIDIFSNGWKPRSAGACNISGGTFIYMAFAEEPLVANVGASIPATAV